MFIINLPISLMKISMNNIRHIRWPAKITSCNNFLVKIIKDGFNWVKLPTICRQRQNFKINSLFNIPPFNPAYQVFSSMGFGVIPDKINLTHMCIQIGQSLNKSQHYLTVLAFVYMVVYFTTFAFKTPKITNLPLVSHWKGIFHNLASSVHFCPGFGLTR